MHQGSNLMASIKLTWDNTSLRVASVWWSSVHASWPVWLALFHTFQPIPVSPGQAHIPVGLWLDWFPIEVWEKGDTLTLLSGYQQDDSPTLLLSGYWQGDCLILPQSGCTLPEVKQEPAGGLIGRWDQKDGVPPLNYPIGTLGDGCTSSIPLPPHCMVVAPQIHWKEVASTNAGCLKEIWVDIKSPERVSTSR